MTTWFAGLFYLPRLFVYHAMSTDKISKERFKIMEKKLFYGIMTPGAILTILTGAWLLTYWDFTQIWIHLKLTCVFVLVLYHFWCGLLIRDFKIEKNKHTHKWFRWFNEFPVLALVGIVFLVIFKPS